MTIITGGQTGADRAAFDAARVSGLEIGGFVPLGRQAEDGLISSAYANLVEANSPDPGVRTRLNVAMADATLIFSHGMLFGGSGLTAQTAADLGKPFLHVDLSTTTEHSARVKVRSWLRARSISKLNIAGPRASEDKLIYKSVYKILLGVFARY